MYNFESFEDVDEWLAPMGYEVFWSAILPTGLYDADDRAHCDATLATGVTDMQTVVTVIKRKALFALVTQFDLPFRYEIAAGDHR